MDVQDFGWTGQASSGDAVTCWRLWQVVPFGGGDYGLAGWSSPQLLWPARRRCEAYCLLDLPESHLVPQPGCRCGLYAFESKLQAQAALAAEMRPGLSVIGRASLWGRTVKHSQGWRAQYAYPYDLFLVGDDERVARALRAAYAVDVDLLPVGELLAAVRRERRRLRELRTQPAPPRAG